MFVTGYVSQLVRENVGVTDEVAECAMRMTEDPIVDIGVLDVICQVSDEGSVDATATKLIGHHERRRNMVGENNLGFGLACCNCLLDKVHTLLMDSIKISKRESVFAKQDAMKIRHILLGIVRVLQVNMRPES